MPITAKPIVIPAKSLDKFWIASLRILAGNPGAKAWFEATLIPYNDAGQTGQPIQLDPLDVFEECAVDPDAAQIMGLFMSYVEKKAVEQGKVEAKALT